MNPDSVTETTELDKEYLAAIRAVNSQNDFASFLVDWKHWLNRTIKFLDPANWSILAPRIWECTNHERVLPIESQRHSLVVELLAPSKILAVTMIKNHFGIPWGAVYLQMRERGIIDY